MSRFKKMVFAGLRIIWIKAAQVGRVKASYGHGRNTRCGSSVNRESTGRPDPLEHLLPYRGAQQRAVLWGTGRLPYALNGNDLASFASAHAGGIDLFPSQWPVYLLSCHSGTTGAISELSGKGWQKNHSYQT